MTTFRIAAPLAAALLALAPLAQAQYDRPIGQPLGTQPYGGQPYGQYGSGPWGAPAGGQYTGQGVVCESHDGSFNECRTPFGGAPAIARTLSSTACVQGQTWGTRGPGSVWVNGGCRAEFVDGGYGYGYGTPPAAGGYAYDDGSLLRCESEDGRQRECRSTARSRMTLVRQISESPCVEGQTWGSNRNGRVWVRGGCRGDFAPVQGWGGAAPAPGWGQQWGGQAITCESVDRRVNYCSWDPRWGRPRVVEQMSQDACQEGRQWGYDGRGQIWVDRGCRARFGS